MAKQSAANTPSDEGTARPGLKKKRIIWASIFAITGVAVGLWSWQHYQKVYNAPKARIPILELIPTAAGKEHQESIVKTVSSANALMAFLPAEQRTKAREIWKDPPKTLDELIEKQKRMDKILTPQQRARVKPIRKFAQDKIVDEMFEAGRNRFKGDDFTKMKDEIKRRVEQRMTQE